MAASSKSGEENKLGTHIKLLDVLIGSNHALQPKHLLNQIKLMTGFMFSSILC